MTDRLPVRKRPAHGVKLVCGQPTIVFGTVCTKGRRCWLACDDVHDLLREVWRDATAWLLGRYVVMPDHVHFFAGKTATDISFDNWVRYWKSQFTTRRGEQDRHWQTGHWDTRMRNAAKYEEKWNYVRHNPVRHGLVSHPDDWPYQGHIHVLPWH